MTDYLAIPPARFLTGALRVPPSKSATNRVLLAAALGAEPVEIVRPLESDDIAALRRCLSALGARIEATADGLRVSGPLSGARTGATALDAEDSGTAARFLAAVCAAIPGRSSLTGSKRLRERPIGELVEALSRSGARIAYAGTPGFLPLSIEGGFLRSGEVAVDASRSSQFFSALLVAALAVDGGLSVRAAGAIASEPYVGLTVETLRALGHDAGERDGAIHAERGRRVAVRYEVPGDYSSAVPVLAAVAAAGGEVRLEGLRRPSSDADAGALPVLEVMGLSLRDAGRGLVATAQTGALRAAQARAGDFPDAVPSLAAVAALAEGTSRFSGIEHLRLKESDRIAASVELIAAAGGRARAVGDTLEVSGPTAPRGGAARIPTHRDHRMAMAGAILALRLPGLLVEDPGCVAKSYPAFFRDLESLRGR